MYGYGDSDGPGSRASGDEFVWRTGASPRSVEHCGLARGAAPPFEPPASRAAGPHDRTRRRRARSEAAPLPAPLSARCGRTMPPGWGTWCRSQAASDPELPRRGGSRATATARGLPPGARTCRGSRGRSPPPAPAEDPRSVAPRGMRNTRAPNHGRVRRWRGALRGTVCISSALLSRRCQVRLP